jgi:hypothetical protein
MADAEDLKSIMTDLQAVAQKVEQPQSPHIHWLIFTSGLRCAAR